MRSSCPTVILIVAVAWTTLHRCTADSPQQTDPAFPSSPLPPVRSNGRLMVQRVNRDADVGDAGTDDFYGNDVRRTIHTYHHVNDGSSADGSGWIIGGSRRRATVGSAQKHYQDKSTVASGDKRREPDDKHQWPVAVAGPDAASSLSEVQVIVHQTPNRNEVGDHQHYQQQQQQQQQDQQQSSDVATKWYSKRLSYTTKTSTPLAATPSSQQQQQQPVVAASNAVLLAEVLRQKAGINNSTVSKGYYGSSTISPTMTGSKGFQNDLMDMLGKSMCRTCQFFLQDHIDPFIFAHLYFPSNFASSRHSPVEVFFFLKLQTF